MDFEMPHAQRHAWNNLKSAVDNYAEVTGSEIAVVTRYMKETQLPVAGDGPTTSESALALHGHGHILLQLRQYLEQIKSGLDAKSRVTNLQGSSQKVIMAGPQEDYHSQAMARSLSSSFQSLKLDNPSVQHKITVREGSRNQPSRRNVPSKGRRSNTVTNGDALELDENLLFEESNGESDHTDSEDDDFDSDNGFGYGQSSYNRRTAYQQGTFQQEDDMARYGTSLPVNIAMNLESHVLPKFSHNPVSRNQLQHNKPVVVQANRERPVPRVHEDTPNPETMMASMQALARSVTDDSALIFGERPRPRLNTGEFKLRDRHK